MSFGVYRPGSSWLYAIDPRAKMLLVLMFLGAVVMARGWFGLAAVAGAAVVLWTGSGRLAKEAVGLVKPLVPLLVFIFLVNGAGTVLSARNLGVAVDAALCQGVLSAVFAVVKLVCALLGAATLMMTTDPAQLTTALRALLLPLRRWGLKVDEIAFMLTAVFRFIPLLSQEVDRIKRAQMSRGASFDTGGLIARVRAWVPVITPLFASGLRRADNLAFAVAARAFFSPAPHATLTLLRWCTRDSVALLAAIALAVAVAVL